VTRSRSAAFAGALILAAAGLQAEVPPAVVAESHAVLAELVGIDSTHAHGSTGVARAIAARLIAAGFPAADVEIVTPEPDKGSVLVRLRGRGRAAPLLLLGHLDVVEARAEDWTVPPFTLTERDGYFYGRGTEDIKGGDAALITNILRLHRAHFVPVRDLYFAFTSDEEAGGTLNGVDWLLNNRPELKKVAYVLNVDAGGGDALAGRPLQLRVQTSEKVYATFRLEVTGRGGHSSLPTPDNPIYELAHGLVRLEAYHFPVHLTPTTRSFLAGIAPLRPALRAQLEAVGRDGDVAAAEELSGDPLLNALLRTTCVATLLQAGHGESALPVRASATVQCRIMPGEKPAAVQATLVQVLADPRISVTPTEPAIESPDSAPNAELMSVVTRIAHEMYPGLPVLLSMDAGASDNVFPRNAGIAAYGVSGLFVDIDDHRLHGRDERVRVSAYDAQVDFLYRLLHAVGGAR
jgi:acetylornithine deacetylase/succinyl-diaminopimelate desuccinylase-like protein